MICNIFTIFIISHYISCFWIRVNSYATGDEYKDYLNAIYFLFVTASTNGYGDITVDNLSTRNVLGRYLFAMMIMLASLIFFAYIQSLIAALRIQWTLVDSKIEETVSVFLLRSLNLTTGLLLEITLIQAAFLINWKKL